MSKYFEITGRVFFGLGLLAVVACSNDHTADLNQIQTASVDVEVPDHTLESADASSEGVTPRVRTKSADVSTPVVPAPVASVEEEASVAVEDEMTPVEEEVAVEEEVEEAEAVVEDAPVLPIVALQAPAVASSFKLLSSNKVEIPVLVSDAYEGNLNFSIERASLDLVDVANEVIVSMEAPTMAVVKGQSAMLSIDVSVASSSPILSGEKFTLVASSDDASIEPVKLDIMFSTIPEIDILLFGGPVAANQPEKWSTEGLGQLAFRQDVKVNFTNMDNVDHRIHFNVGDLHQDDNLANGQTYTVDLELGGNFNFYCHNHEAGNMRQTVDFIE